MLRVGSDSDRFPHHRKERHLAGLFDLCRKNTPKGMFYGCAVDALWMRIQKERCDRCVRPFFMFLDARRSIDACIYFLDANVTLGRQPGTWILHRQPGTWILHGQPGTWILHRQPGTWILHRQPGDGAQPEISGSPPSLRGRLKAGRNFEK